jgi:hypothetical protein
MAENIVANTLTATIPTGATALSPAIDLAGKTVVNILMSVGWVTAVLTFQGSHDDITYGNIYDATTGAEYSITVAAGVAVGIPPASPLLGWRFLKVRSGTLTTPVNQTTARALVIGCRPV